jgi:hypothetical protein
MAISLFASAANGQRNTENFDRLRHQQQRFTYWSSSFIISRQKSQKSFSHLKQKSLSLNTFQCHIDKKK